MSATQRSWDDTEIEQALCRLESAVHSTTAEHTLVTEGSPLTWRDLRLLSDVAGEMYRLHCQPRSDLDSICTELSQKFTDLLAAANVFNDEEHADLIAAFDYLIRTAPDLVVVRDDLVQQALRQRNSLTMERWFIYERLERLLPDRGAVFAGTIWQLFEAVEASVQRAGA